MRIRNLKDDDGLLLTPLIDMIFLVVIFFMLNATLSVNPAIRVDLPPAYTSQAVIEDQIVVTLNPGGDIYIGKTAVSMDRFPAELKQELARLKLKKMILRADEATPYKLVVEIMDLARLSGMEAIALVTTKKSMAE
jgi:biopolymer transport protein ExbD